MLGMWRARCLMRIYDWLTHPNISYTHSSSIPPQDHVIKRRKFFVVVVTAAAEWVFLLFHLHLFYLTVFGFIVAVFITIVVAAAALMIIIMNSQRMDGISFQFVLFRVHKRSGVCVRGLCSEWVCIGGNLIKYNVRVKHLFELLTTSFFLFFFVAQYISQIRPDFLVIVNEGGDNEMQIVHVRRWFNALTHRRLIWKKKNRTLNIEVYRTFSMRW